MRDVKDIIEDIILKDVKQPLWENWYIREKIGSGAFAIVYRVEAKRPGRIDSSALKIEVVTSGDQVFADNSMKLSFLASKQAMVENETQMMVDLRDCPNIVRYEDETMKELYIDGEFEGYYYLIRMELLSAVTDQMRKRTFDYSEENIRKLGADIGNGLKAAHDKGIIHRDIKPGNFFVSENGTYKLGDFNIAKQAVSTRSFAGTDYYMAPEVFRAKSHAEVRYTKQADIYSLGICLYQMMNKGLLPFEDELPTEEAIDKRLTGAPLKPPCNASPEFARIILKACECNTAARYRSIDEFLADLDSSGRVSPTVYERRDTSNMETTYLPQPDQISAHEAAFDVQAVPSVVPSQVPSVAPVAAPSVAPAAVPSSAPVSAPVRANAAPAAKAPKKKVKTPKQSSGAKPPVSKVIIICAVVACLMLAGVIFFSSRMKVRKGMLTAATNFCSAVAAADTDDICSMSTDKDLEDKIGNALDFSSRGPYDVAKSRLLAGISGDTEFTIIENTAKVNMAGDEGSVDVIFTIPDYQYLLSHLNNVHTVDQMLLNLHDIDDVNEIKVNLKLSKVKGKWLISNAEAVSDEVHDYVNLRVRVMSPLAGDVSGYDWFLSDEDGNYTNIACIWLDLRRGSFDNDWSGVYYTVCIDGVRVYTSDHGDDSGMYGEDQNAQKDEDGFLIPGTYEFTFYDQNDAYVASATTVVD